MWNLKPRIGDHPEFSYLNGLLKCYNKGSIEARCSCNIGK